MFFRRPGACISDPPFEAAKKDRGEIELPQKSNPQRGAWIEIAPRRWRCLSGLVAPRKGSVD